MAGFCSYLCFIGCYAMLAKLHQQQPLYSSISVLGTCFCVTVLPSHRRIYILSPFFKTGNDVNTALHTTFYLCSLLFLQWISSQKCIISSTLSKPKHFRFIAIIVVEPIYLKHEQQSQKNILIPFNGHATLYTIQQAIVLNRTSDKLIRYMFLIG